MEKVIKIIGFTGSLRRNSYNKAALNAAKELLPADANLEIVDLSLIPFFNEDLESEGIPEAVVQFKQKLAELQLRKETYQAYIQELKETSETQILTTDPEARMMRTKDGYACCYNVQTAVDQTSHLIAEYAVTNSCNDYNYLTKVAQDAMNTLGVETIHVGADKGYDDKDEIKQCVMNGIIPHVGLKNDKDERLMVLEYEEATVSEKDRESTKPEDIQRCIKAGILPKCYENTLIGIEYKSKISSVVLSAMKTIRLPAPWGVF